MATRVEDKKRQKRESLFAAAFSLFTSKGINNTSISDIARKANMAKGTFYLYFKDKFDIRDKLIANKATQLLSKASEEANKQVFKEFSDKIIFLADFIINLLNKDKPLLVFISKNLSWGVFQNVLSITQVESADYSFYDGYLQMIDEYGKKLRNPELMLFMIVELINSTCHNVILYEKPVKLNELKKELYPIICEIIKTQEM